MTCRQRQNKVVGIKRFQTGLEYCFRISKGTVSNAFIWVLSNLIKGAHSALAASTQRLMQRHHWSPASNPGNWYSGLGVVRSFPFCRLNCKNASVTIAQTKWLPTSSSFVLQQPSLKKPVSGSNEQGIRGSPNTLSATSFCIETSNDVVISQFIQ